MHIHIAYTVCMHAHTYTTNLARAMSITSLAETSLQRDAKQSLYKAYLVATVRVTGLTSFHGDKHSATDCGVSNIPLVHIEHCIL